MPSISDIRFTIGELMANLDELISDGSGIIQDDHLNSLREFENKIQDIDIALEERESP